MKVTFNRSNVTDWLGLREIIELMGTIEVLNKNKVSFTKIVAKGRGKDSKMQTFESITELLKSILNRKRNYQINYR